MDGDNNMKEYNPFNMDTTQATSLQQQVKSPPKYRSSNEKRETPGAEKIINYFTKQYNH